MKLADLPVLIMDVQTTGLSPSTGRIIDFAWMICQGANTLEEARDQQFDPGGEIPKRVREIINWREGNSPCPPAELWLPENFKSWQGDRPELSTTVIHGANFERAFLQNLILWPKDVICTQTLTRRFFPDLPSTNLRAVAGYFGHPVVGPNQALTFVNATAAIWRGVLNRLTALNIETLDELHHRTNAKTARTKRATRPYAYRLPDSERLHLPPTPGIYKMKTRHGDILYVGKATSLKERVNSYFRGRKNRDRKKLEMLAQVWSIDVEECRTPLEAALRETDEIKRLDPPYNIALKLRDRRLIFYSRDFSSTADQQNSSHPLGPYRSDNFLEILKLCELGAKNGDLSAVFYNPIAEDVLRQGFSLFLESEHQEHLLGREFRDWVAFAIRLSRRFGHETPLSPDSESAPLDADYVSGKFSRLFRRAGAEAARARQLTRSLNMEVAYQFKGRELRLYVQQGQWTLEKQPNFPAKKFPWANLSVETYDRLSILLNELSRHKHYILRQPEVET